MTAALAAPTAAPPLHPPLRAGGSVPGARGSWGGGLHCFGVLEWGSAPPRVRWGAGVGVCPSWGAEVGVCPVGEFWGLSRQAELEWGSAPSQGALECWGGGSARLWGAGVGVCPIVARWGGGCSLLLLLLLLLFWSPRAVSAAVCLPPSHRLCSTTHRCWGLSAPATPRCHHPDVPPCKLPPSPFSLSAFSSISFALPRPRSPVSSGNWSQMTDFRCVCRK